MSDDEEVASEVPWQYFFSLSEYLQLHPLPIFVLRMADFRHSGATMQYGREQPRIKLFVHLLVHLHRSLIPCSALSAYSLSSSRGSEWLDAGTSGNSEP